MKPLALLFASIAIAAATSIAGDDAVTARVRVRVVGADGAPLEPAAVSLAPIEHDGTADRDGAAAPLRALGGATFESDPLPLPIDGRVRASGAGGADAIFRVSAARSEGGIVDLGDVALDPGVDVLVRVVDEKGTPVAGASVHRIADGAPFPPRDPDARHPRITRLDASTRLGATGDDGILRCALRREAPAVIVLAPAPEGSAGVRFAIAEAKDAAAEAVVGRGPTLRVLVLADSPRLLPQGTVPLVVDLGGAQFEMEVGLATETAIGFDADRAVSLSIEEQGFRGAAGFVESIPGEVRALRLEAVVPLGFARVTAVDKVTKTPLRIDALRLGRARSRDRDRIDFAPDWHSFVLSRDGAGGETSLLCAAPKSTVDLLVSAEGHLDTLFRALRFDGHSDDPTPIELQVEVALPVQGRVIDAKTGEPIAGARVAVRKATRDLDDLPLAWKLAGTVGYLDARTTRDNGGFRFALGAWEDLRFEVEADGYAIASFGPVQRSLAHDVRIPLERGFRVAGRVVDAKPGDCAYLFDPVANRRLRAPVEVSGTGSAGTFAFEPVAPGRWRALAGEDDRPLLFGRLESRFARLEKLYAGGAEIEVKSHVSDFELRRVAAD